MLTAQAVRMALEFSIAGMIVVAVWENKEESLMRQRTKILVVDDERAVASTLAIILEHEGYETATTYSGEEAVGRASTFQPDFLLSDIDMGELNGIDAAIEILEFLPHCKVLFISGHPAWRELQAQAKAQGFDFEVLNKPVPPSELLERISQVISCDTADPEPRTVRKPPARARCNKQTKASCRTS